MAKAQVPGGLARDPLYFYHLSNRLGLVMLSIPKNACTVQKAWLLHAEGIAERDVHKGAFTHLSLLNRIVISRSALATLPLVVFLRDPFDRLVSGFVDKLVSPRLNLSAVNAIEGAAERRGTRIVRDAEIPFDPAEPGRLLAACSAVDYRRGLTFREFVESIAATPDLKLDPHWRPQAWFMTPAWEREKAGTAPEMAVHTMADVSDTLGALGEPIGLPAPPPPSSAAKPAPRDESAPGALAGITSGELAARDAKPRARDLYTPDLAALVRQRFAEDIRLWERITDAARQPAPA